MDQRSVSESDYFSSFYIMRRWIGYIGILLPLVLLIIGARSESGPVPSISAYYYTPAGDFLVGAICTIALFFFAYNGYPLRTGEFISDKLLAKSTALGALGVAFIPTTANQNSISLKDCKSFFNVGNTEGTLPFAHQIISPDCALILHYASADIFFSSLAIFCLVAFQRDSGISPITKSKILLNRICWWCGIVLVSVIVFLAIYAWYYSKLTRPEKLQLETKKIVFYLESIGLWAFALAWIAKGRIRIVFLDRYNRISERVRRKSS